MTQSRCSLLPHRPVTFSSACGGGSDLLAQFGDISELPRTCLDDPAAAARKDDGDQPDPLSIPARADECSSGGSATSALGRTQAKGSIWRNDHFEGIASVNAERRIFLPPARQRACSNVGTSCLSGIRQRCVSKDRQGLGVAHSSRRPTRAPRGSDSASAVRQDLPRLWRARFRMVQPAQQSRVESRRCLDLR